MSDLQDKIARLRADPLDEAVADEVRALGRLEEAYEAWAAAFVARAEALAERGEVDLAVRARVEAALVYEEELGALEPAAAQYEAVLALEPLHRRALFALGLLFHDLGRWQDLVDLYRTRIAATDHQGEQTTLHLYTAEVLSDRLGDEHAAFVEVMAAARLAPQNIRIIGRLEKLGASTGRHEEVAVTIGDLILNQEDPKVRAALSLRLAELHLGPLGNEQRALSYLKSALADDGGNPEVLHEVEDVFRERDRFDDLAALLEHAAEDRRVGPHRVRLGRELARIYERELDDPHRALVAMTRAVRHAPEDRELLDEVLRLGLTTGDLAAVGATYAWVIEQTDNALLQTYMRLKLGHIYGNVLGRADEAIEAYWAILESDPGHHEARRRLLRMHERRGDHPQIAQLLELDADELEGAPESRALLERLLDLYVDRIDDPARAVEASRRLLALDPEHPRALEVMRDAPNDDPSRPAAPAVPPGSAGAPRTMPPPPPPDEAGELAEVADSAVLSSVDEAATVFDGEGYGPESETQFSDPDEMPVLRRLANPSAADMQVDEDDEEDVHEDSNATIALLDDQVLSAESEVEAPVQVAALADEVEADEAEADEAEADEDEVDEDMPVRLHVPSLAEGEDVEDEVEEGAWAPSPSSPPVLSVVPGGDADEASEGESAPVSLAPPTSPFLSVVAEAHEALRQKEAEDGKTHGLAAREAEIQAELERADPERALELLDELVALAESREDPSAAFDAQVQLTLMDPDVERIEDLMRLGEVTERYAELRDAADRAIAALGDAAEARFGLALARIELERLGAPAEAAERFGRRYAAGPHDPALFGQWMAALEAAGRAEEMAVALVARAKEEEDAREAQLFLQRGVGLFETELSSPSRAADAVLEFEATRSGQEALRAQAAELLDAAGRHEDLVALHTRDLERLEGEPRAALRLRIAALYRAQLDAPEAAEAMLRQGLEERARDPNLLEALWGLLEADGRYEALFEVGQRWAEVTEAPEARAALRLRLARIAQDELADDARAEAELSAAHDDAPADLEILRGLEALRRARADWDGVHDVLERIVARAEGADRAEALRALAEIRAEHRGDLDGAADLLRSALALEPEHDAALGFLAEVEERRGDFVGAADVLRAHIEARPPERRAPVHARLGALLRTHFEDLAGARAQYEAVLALEPDDAESVQALLSIAVAESDWVAAHGLATRAAGLCEDDRRRAELWGEAGDIAQARLGDDRRAIDAFEQALAADPEDLLTRARVGELYLARGAYARAHPHLVSAAEGLGDPERAAELLLSAGRAAERAEDLPAAEAAFFGVLERRPTEREALERLSAMLDAGEQWDRAYDVAANLVLHHEARLSTRDRSQVYLRMARARRGQGQLEDAHRLAKQAYRLDPSAPAPLEIMAACLEAEGDAFEAAECLKRLAPLLETDEDKKQALLRAGRLLQEKAEDPARAAAMLTEAQDLAPDDEEVGQRLAVCRAEVGDPAGSADALCVLAERYEGRARADLQVQAARVLLGANEDRARAKSLLHAALEGVPTHLGARRDLEVVLEFDEALEALAEHWVAWAEALFAAEVPAEDLDGVPGPVAGRARLEAALDLYRDRLGAPGRALEVLRRLMASDDADRWLEPYARTLDAVIEAKAAGADDLVWEAIRAWSTLAEARPGRIEALQRLYALRAGVGEVHLARIAQELLAALGAPMPNGAVVLGEPVALERIEAVSVTPVPEERTDLGALVEALGYAPVHAVQDSLPIGRLKKKELVGPAGLGIGVSRPLEAAARALGVDVPPVYVREDLEAGLSAAVVGEGPALVVSLGRLSALDEAALRFLFGRALSLSRPSALALAVVPLDALREALVGFAKEDPEACFVDAKGAKRRGRALEKAVAASARDALAARISTWLAAPQRPSLGAQKQAVLRTAERAGLVASGSLAVSLETLSGMVGGRMDRAWRLPLIRFAATREYAEIIRRRGG